MNLSPGQHVTIAGRPDAPEPTTAIVVEVNPFNRRTAPLAVLPGSDLAATLQYRERLVEVVFTAFHHPDHGWMDAKRRKLSITPTSRKYA